MADAFYDLYEVYGCVVYGIFRIGKIYYVVEFWPLN